MKTLLLNIIAVAVTLPVFGSPPMLSPSVLTTDQEVIDAMGELVEFPQAAIYSSLTDIANFTLHIRNNNEVRAVHYDETYYWAFTDAIEKAIDNLPPIELSRKNQGDRECHDINISINFGTLCNPLFKFMYVEIEDMVPPRYDAKYGSYGLILELLSDDDRLELYNQGAKSLLVTLYIERDGSVPNVAISTLSGDKVAQYK